jgi:hypothetical protein
MGGADDRTGVLNWATKPLATSRGLHDECPFPEEPQDVAFPLMIPLSMEVRDIFAQIPRHRQWASLIVAVGVSNFAHAPLIRHASAAKASESMAVFLERGV